MSSTAELIEEKKQEIRRLKQELLCREAELDKLLSERGCQEVGGEAELSNEEIRRYSRQMILPELRPGGQRRLKASSVAVIGCGGEVPVPVSSLLHLNTRSGLSGGALPGRGRGREAGPGGPRRGGGQQPPQAGGPHRG